MIFTTGAITNRGLLTHRPSAAPLKSGAQPDLPRTPPLSPPPCAPPPPGILEAGLPRFLRHRHVIMPPKRKAAPTKAEIVEKLKARRVHFLSSSTKPQLEALLAAEEAALATMDSSAAGRAELQLVLQREDTWTKLGGFDAILRLSLVCKSWNLLIQRADCILPALAQLKPEGFMYLDSFFEHYMFYPSRLKTARFKDSIK